MEEWLRVCLLLCVFGYFKEFRPSEPFIVDFLTGPWHNLTSQDIYQDMFPTNTYAYLAHVVLIFLITDLFRYKPIIILCGISGTAAFCFLTWGTNWTYLYLHSIFQGTFLATEIAYYTYIYAKVDKDHYQKVTSYTRAAVLTGSFSASVLGQVLLFTMVMDFKQLMFITVGALATASIWSFFLPPVTRSLYFHRTTSPEGRISLPSYSESQQSLNQHVEISEEIVKEHVTLLPKISSGVKLLWSHFLSAYSQKEVVLWSLWYSLAKASFLQVQYYVQILWKDIVPDLEQSSVWSGAVEAALTILGATASLLAGHIKIETLHFGLLTVTISSTMTGGFLIMAAQTTILWVSYLGYISSGVIYHFIITFSSYNIAKHLIEDSFGLVFGINTLAALILQTILTVIVNSEGGLQLLPRHQFTVYGGCYVVTGIIYCVAAAVSYFGMQRGSSNLQ